ncbi:MAG: hypothetical protein WD491_07870 [Balneolales bacterium]
MPYEKRQIIELPFHGGNHPAVIISVEDVYHREGYYICLMITTSPARDEFSFVLSDEDMMKPMAEPSQVRLHLIGCFSDADVISNANRNTMKIEAFDRMIDYMAEKVFGTEFLE